MSRLKAKRVRGAEEVWGSGRSGSDDLVGRGGASSSRGSTSSSGTSEGCGGSGGSFSKVSIGSKCGFGVRREIINGITDRLHSVAIHLLQTVRQVDSQSRIIQAWLSAPFHAPIPPSPLPPPSIPTHLLPHMHQSLPLWHLT